MRFRLSCEQSLSQTPPSNPLTQAKNRIRVIELAGISIAAINELKFLVQQKTNQSHCRPNLTQRATKVLSKKKSQLIT